MSALPKPMTIDEFVAWEERQELRYEFDGFAARAMTGGTLRPCDDPSQSAAGFGQRPCEGRRCRAARQRTESADDDERALSRRAHHLLARPAAVHLCARPRRDLRDPQPEFGAPGSRRQERGISDPAVAEALRRAASEPCRGGSVSSRRRGRMDLSSSCPPQARSTCPKSARGSRLRKFTRASNSRRERAAPPGREPGRAAGGDHDPRRVPPHGDHLWRRGQLVLQGNPNGGGLSSDLLSLFTAINQAWFMGLFFLLAGYFTPGAVDAPWRARLLARARAAARPAASRLWICSSGRRRSRSRRPPTDGDFFARPAATVGHAPISSPGRSGSPRPC